MIELATLLEATGGRLVGTPDATSFSDWCYDSRLARPGQIFVAVRTERRDGHAFIADAIAGGCTGVLCEHPPAIAAASVVVVDDTLAALERWATATVRRFAPCVVAVTGSVGKSSTKRAIATLLAGQGPVFRSRRSFNSLFGLPLALGSLGPEHRYAVLEMGVDRFGEMARLAACFPPTVAVVTNVAPTHLRYLRDEVHIAAEKGALVAALPSDGYAVLNADDPHVRAMAQRTSAHIIWYGLDGDTASPDTLTASLIETNLHGTHFTVRWHDQIQHCALPLVGRHSAYIALAGIGAALACGVPFREAVMRCGSIELQNGRLRPLGGRNGSTILDDTYNASPRSALRAVEALRDLPARRRIAVLGDMLELGERGPDLHHALGVAASAIVDLLVTKGDLAASIAEGALLANPTAPVPVVTHTTWDAAQAAQSGLGPGDLVLVKGSADARMEAIVAALLDPSLVARDVLVRQEAPFEVVRVATFDRPTWLEIDLEAIGSNMERIGTLVGPRVAVMAVLKADAYGHGAVRVARTVLRRGASSLGVATVGEAVNLRDAGIRAPILVLGYTPPWQVRDALRRDVQLTVWEGEVARECTEAARDLNLRAQVHVKVDTGMARLGIHPDEALQLLGHLQSLEGVDVAGLFTHLATSDAADRTPAQAQLERFAALVAAAEKEGLRPPVVHAANSAAVFRFPEAHWDMVRPGIALYGLDPSPDAACPEGFRPALAFKTAVAQVKTLPTGSPVSYGGTYVTARPTRLATIPVGYADGFRRSPSWRTVLVRGQHAPVVGRVCMDYAMLDVTDIPGVMVGDEAVLIGSQNDQTISASDVANWLGTINYEVVAAILPRVPRMV